MSRSPPRETSQSSAAAEYLAQLRRLLLEPEQHQLAELRALLENYEPTAEQLSRLLPAAILLREGRDGKLAESLAPLLEDSFQSAVRRNPHRLVSIISPIMGPSIRRAIVQSITGMVQSLNHVLDQSLSLRGFRWRLEAMRTGKSFAEVVLLHTLVYRVEQVFLIHRESGLKLAHVAADPSLVADADMVSGMLTAIRDFVHDSLGGGEEDHLHSLRMGECTVWVEQGTHAALAAVIRGEAPETLRARLQETLENIHLRHLDELEDFTGDASVFEASHTELEDCLQVQYAQEAARGSRWKGALAVLAVVLIALTAAGWGIFRYAQQTSRWANCLRRLRQEPGLVVTEAQRWFGSYSISGLRDPLAGDPQEIIRSSQLDPDRVSVRWQPYHCLEPEFSLRRAAQLLDPPPTVKLERDDAALRASGTADESWIERARQMAPQLAAAGIGQLELTDVENVDRPWSDAIARLRAERGYLVTETVRQNGGYSVAGLRDPLARDPGEVLDGLEIRAEDFHWRPYQSAEFALPRVHDLLEPPEDVTLELQEGVLVIQGQAPRAWTRRARDLAPLVAGIASVDATAVVDSDAARESLLARLSQEAGFVVTESWRQGDKNYVRGLRDPLAADPGQLLKELGLQAEQYVFEWKPYISRQPQIVERRLRRVLQPPPTVELKVDGDHLRIPGEAPYRWLVDRWRPARLVADFEGLLVDDRELVDVQSRELDRLLPQLRGTVVYFEGNSERLRADEQDSLTALAERINLLTALLDSMGKELRITLLGHCAPSADEDAHQNLSRRRAERLLQLLNEKGLPEGIFTTVGLGASQPPPESKPDYSTHRRVTLRIDVP